MMTLRSTLFLLAAAAGLSTVSFAQTTQAPAGQPPKKTLDPNEVVCEKQIEPGSRLATKRVCMTRAQWADRKSQDRQETERVQVQRGCNNRC
jgi:invasion protein IalB